MATKSNPKSPTSPNKSHQLAASAPSFNPYAPSPNPSPLFIPPAFVPASTPHYTPSGLFIPPSSAQYYPSEDAKFDYPYAYYSDPSNIDEGAVQDELLPPPPLIKVMQYNILADCYTKSDSFPYCPDKYLEWSYRFEKIMKTIVDSDADVVCLQEVESDMYFETMKDYLMEKGGYSSIFKKRPHPHKKDGCAIFFKDSKLEIITKTELSYNSLAKDKHAGDRAQTNNIAIGIYFQETSQHRKRFWVVNTHLFWDPKAPDVKLGQTKMLKKFITNQLQRSPGGVIIAGDFNSMPTSSVCDFLIEDGLFASAYALEGALDTNITPWFSGCIDYIWYTPQELTLDNASDLKEARGDSEYIPDANHPSDHLPLSAVFSFREDSGLMMSRHGAVDKCRYDLLCRRPNCKYSHSLLCSSGMDCPIKEECRHAHVIPCKFGVACFKEGCKFNHLPCKFGSVCTNPHCMYSH
jgi:mRNA deadenylase 3'-5' endonuclease subunit Ccr4